MLLICDTANVANYTDIVSTVECRILKITHRANLV